MKILNRSLIVLAIAVSIQSCSDNKTDTEYLNEAAALVEQKEPNAAIIELKNGIKQSPSNPEFRIMLGELYASQGLYVSAEKELKKALDSGGSKQKVLPSLLRSLAKQNKFTEVLSTLNDAEVAQDDPLFYMYEAIAYVRLNQLDKAELAVAKAQDISNESAYTYLGKAFLYQEEAELNETIELVNKAIEIEPGLTEAYVLLGQLYFLKKNYGLALEFFEKYQQMVPSDSEVKIFIANSYLNNKKTIEAEKILTTLIKQQPEHAFINQLIGLVNYEKEDYENAIIYTDKAIQNGLDTIGNRVVVGISAYRQKRYELAHRNLIRTSKYFPDTHPINQVLSVVEIQLADESSSNIETDTIKEVDLLIQESFILSQLGEFDKVSDTFNSVSAQTENPQQLTQIGILKISNNDVSGIIDLEKAIELDPSANMTKAALAKSYIALKEYDKAFVIANDWIEQFPDKTVGHILSARLYFLLDNQAEAKNHLENALQIDEFDTYSLVHMAQLAMQENDNASAVAYLKKSLSHDSTNIVALTYLYRASNKLGKASEALNKIKDNYEGTQEPKAAILYAVTLHKEKNYQQSIEVLSLLNENTVGSSVIYWITLADSYIKLEMNEKAIQVYDRMLSYRPGSKLALYSKVKLYETLKQYDYAQKTTLEALQLHPLDADFNSYAIYFAILQGDYEKATTHINNLPNEQKSNPVNIGFSGEIDLNSENYSSAATKLKQSYLAAPTVRNLVLLVEAYDKSANKQAAFELLKVHYETTEQNLLVKNLLAEYAIEFDLNLSQQLYEEIVAVVPNQIAILNNLAWVEYKLNNLSKALVASNKALSLSPNHPMIMDTQALILYKQGKKEEAIAILERAYELAPSNEKIASHLTEAKKGQLDSVE